MQFLSLEDYIVSYSEDEKSVSIEFLNASKRQLLNPEEMNITILSDRLRSKKVKHYGADKSFLRT